MISRLTADKAPRTDVRDLARTGLIWRSATACKVRNASVRLVWTACAKGGERPWFLCPSCSRRVAILYGIDRPQCRTCTGFRYSTQYMTLEERLEARRKRLQWTYLGLWPVKPKGRHTATQKRWQAATQFFEMAQDAIYLCQLRRVLRLEPDWQDVRDLIEHARMFARAGHRRRRVF